MSRPQPKILLEALNRSTYRAEQVLAAKGVYFVVYQNQPISLRDLNTLVSYPGPKYKKVSFPSKAHAFNLADRLNQLFRTQDFSVAEVAEYRTITRDQ